MNKSIHTQEWDNVDIDWIISKHFSLRHNRINSALPLWWLRSTSLVCHAKNEKVHNLFVRTVVRLCCFVFMWLNCCYFTHLHNYTNVRLCDYTDMELCNYVTAQMSYRIIRRLHKCAVVHINKNKNTEFCIYAVGGLHNRKIMRLCGCEITNNLI